MLDVIGKAEERYLAVICEGNAEINYLNILLADDKLIFSKEELLGEKLLPRNVKKFVENYLHMQYEKPLILLLVQDNNDTFKIPKPYDEKIKDVFKVITTPEIEMVMIHHFGYYDEFNKVKSGRNKKKPCEFLAEKFKVKTSKIKSKGFINKTFTPASLAAAIQLYTEKSPKRNKEAFELIDLLK